MTSRSPVAWWSDLRSTARSACKPITAGSGIHCYDTFTADSNGPSQGGADRFVIKVVDDSTLHIEHQSGSCSSGVSFQSPHVYSRYQQ